MVAVLKSHLGRNIGSVNGDDGKRAIAVAAAIYGSMRFSQSRDTIKRILEAEGAHPKVQVAAKGIFEQVGNIASLRDKLAHFATKPAEGGDGFWETTDYFSNRNISRTKEFIVGTDSIGLAANDLSLAATALWNSKGDKDLFSEKILEPIAWQYKPSMLKHQN